MYCRSCGAELPRDAVYCLRCGERVELGSALGVGTDVPPAQDAPVEDLSQTRELPRMPVTPPASAGQPHTPERPAPAPGPVAAAPADGHASSGGPAHSRGTIAAMIATFVVLTLIGTFALTRILGSDESGTTASTAAPTTSAEEGEESASASPSPEASLSSPAAPSPTATPSESAASIPAGARRCSTSGSDAVATAYAATERTSCEFAGAVREAYRKVGTPEGATTLRAFSPVTKKWYSLSCDGGAPVRCTSTTNAVVLLAP